MGEQTSRGIAGHLPRPPFIGITGLAASTDFSGGLKAGLPAGIPGG
jgi:hypothetical protein